MTHLYVLLNSKESPCYVGITRKSCAQRWTAHSTQRRRGARTMVHVASFESFDHARRAENWASRFLRAAGYRLGNREGRGVLCSRCTLTNWIFHHELRVTTSCSSVRPLRRWNRYDERKLR